MAQWIALQRIPMGLRTHLSTMGRGSALTWTKKAQARGVYHWRRIGDSNP